MVKDGKARMVRMMAILTDNAKCWYAARCSGVAANGDFAHTFVLMM